MVRQHVEIAGVIHDAFEPSAKWTLIESPRMEDYADRMPFGFTGTLTIFAVVLKPHNLSEEEQKRLHDMLTRAMMAVQ